MVNEFLSNTPIWAGIIGWLSAQVIKVILTLFSEKRLDLTRLYGSGGMPSSHTSFVMALTFSIGKIHGFNIPSFAVSLAFSFVVMYDAAGVRRAAGKQAAVLNKLIFHSGLKPEEQLKELLGHTPLQVMAGAVLGIFVGLLF
ncbi:MAG TPA: divergent PAP2 family protein [Candidatus Fimicola cottocaccae]|nr:divergent PAP2 family protein [Candidatus Fimicola cottocaccae]